MNERPPPTGAPPPGPASAPSGLARREWRAPQAFMGLAVMVVALVLEGALVYAIDPGLESLAATLTLQVLLAATMAGVAIAVVAEGRIGQALADRREDAGAGRGAGLPGVLEALGFRPPVIPAVKPTIGAYLAYIASALALAVLIAPEQEDITRELGADEGTLGTIAAGALIIVAAPLGEEIFFRGFLFAGIRRSAGFWAGALASSTVWGVFHFTGPGSWGVVLQLAIFGIALAWLYERTNSLWPPIVLHVFNNALAFTLLTTS